MSLNNPRGTSNSNARGSSKSRRARREWLIENWGQLGVVCCFFCGTWLTVDTVTVDRIIPGEAGGRYVHGNIRPACLSCNSTDGNLLRWHGKRPAGSRHLMRRKGRLLHGQVVSIVHLRLIARLTHAQIAQEVGCSIASVRTHLKPHIGRK